jgi:predicted Fe-Mo cluster-binding NifX family protein
MRIAVPVTAGQIPNHFGHCESFLVAEVAAGTITSQRLLPNPRHGPGGPPPAFVASQGVTQVLAWGIPPHAAEALRGRGIAVQLGVTGAPDAALAAFLAGTLSLTTEGLDAGGGCGGHGHDQASGGGHHHP